MADSIHFSKDGIVWSGQTIGDSKGRVLFGKDATGALHIEIVNDNDGVLHANRAMFPEGKAIVDYLFDWFK